jgi:hypothetical protein
MSFCLLPSAYWIFEKCNRVYKCSFPKYHYMDPMSCRLLSSVSRNSKSPEKLSMFGSEIVTAGINVLAASFCLPDI